MWLPRNQKGEKRALILAKLTAQPRKHQNGERMQWSAVFQRMNKVLLRDASWLKSQSTQPIRAIPCCGTHPLNRRMRRLSNCCANELQQAVHGLLKGNILESTLDFGPLLAYRRG